MKKSLAMTLVALSTLAGLAGCAGKVGRPELLHSQPACAA